ncbi:MAG: hypothetical protein JWP12_252 [Bacteroidetes bacterium]|nr:hypothetical protein [Bacteroidota bacterium]
MSKDRQDNIFKEPIRLNRRVITFLVCVLVSMFFWLMMMLSKEYNIIVSYPVEYMNTPKDRVISNLLPKEIDIEIRAKGFFLLAYKFKKAQTVYVDLEDSRPMATKNYFYLLTNSRINKMTEQFSSRIKVQRIMPDTIFLNFNRKVSKRVPVKANINLTVDSQYQQSDSIRLIPDHIQVSGAADVLEKINFVETVPVTIKNLNESRTLVLDIAKSQNAGYMETNFSQVKAQIHVKKYTEASVELTIEAINLPNGYSLKSFPDKVLVKYDVAFDNYQNINASQFRAVIDYKKAEPNSNKLKIVLETFPEGIRSIKLNPEKVEFIIKK